MSFQQRIQAHTLTRAERLKTMHGIAVGDPCPNCGDLAVDDGRAACDNCGRPWPVQCHGWYDASGEHHGCGVLLHPDEARGSWMSRSQCDRCDEAPRRERARGRLADVFVGMEDDIDFIDAGHYKKAKHQQALNDAMGDWEGKRLVLVYGPCGSGKSMTVLRWAKEQTLRGSDVLWLRSRDLIRAFKMSDGREEAAALVAKVKAAKVLIVDEFQAAACRDWTPNVFAEMSYLVQDRLDRSKMRAVFITNRPPNEALPPLGEMVVSRFKKHGLAVECNGPDLRGD